MSFSAVILAGGQSRRMGTDKAFLEFDGRTLLARLLENARNAGAGEIFISGRPGVDYDSYGTPVLLDLEPGFGPLGGIERGLHSASLPLVLFVPVDLPALTCNFIRKMHAACDQWTGVVPKLNHGFEPLVAFYPKRCYAIVLDHMCKFKRAARDFAQACLRERAVKTLVVPKSQFGLFENWNAPLDVQSATPRSPKPVSTLTR